MGQGLLPLELLVLPIQAHLVHPASVVGGVLPLEGGQLILQNVEVGEVLVVGEVPVRVVLAQLVQVLGVVQLLLVVHRVQVLQAHVVLVQVLVVCLLVQRGDNVVQLCSVVVPGLRGRRHRRGGGPASAGRCRLAQRVCRGPVSLPEIGLLVAAPQRVFLLAPGEVRPVDDGIQKRLLLFRVLVVVHRRILVEREGTEVVDLVQHTVNLVGDFPVGDVVRPLGSSGVSAIAGPELVGRLVGQQFCLRRGGLVNVLFQPQDGVSELRILLRRVQVCLGELSQQAGVAGCIDKTVIRKLWHIVPPFQSFSPRRVRGENTLA